MRYAQISRHLPALVLALLVATPALADDERDSYRRYDDRGRFTGTVRESGEDRLRFYDEKGHLTGTSRRQHDGSWRLYDSKGAYSGTLRPQTRQPPEPALK